MKFFNYKKIFLGLILLILFFVLMGCTMKKDNEEYLQEKVDEELKYSATELLTMLNTLNGITTKNYTVVTEKSSQSNSSSDSEQKGTSEENEKSGSDSNTDSEKTSRKFFWKYNNF